MILETTLISLINMNNVQLDQEYRNFEPYIFELSADSEKSRFTAKFCFSDLIHDLFLNKSQNLEMVS